MPLTYRRPSLLWVLRYLLGPGGTGASRQSRKDGGPGQSLRMHAEETGLVTSILLSKAFEHPPSAPVAYLTGLNAHAIYTVRRIAVPHFKASRI